MHGRVIGSSRNSSRYVCRVFDGVEALTDLPIDPPRSASCRQPATTPDRLARRCSLAIVHHQDFPNCARTALPPRRRPLRTRLLRSCEAALCSRTVHRSRRGASCTIFNHVAPVTNAPSRALAGHQIRPTPLKLLRPSHNPLRPRHPHPPIHSNISKHLYHDHRITYYFRTSPRNFLSRQETTQSRQKSFDCSETIGKLVGSTCC